MARRTKTGSTTAIINGDLYFDEARQFPITHEEFSGEIELPGVTSIRVESLRTEWVQREWIGNELYTGTLSVEMTLRKEKRGLQNHWYAYRRFAGKLHKRYVGKSEDITQERIIEIAQKLPCRSNLKPTPINT